MRVALDTTNHPGPGRGEGHLQSAGRRDGQTAAGRWRQWRRPKSKNGPSPGDTSGSWPPASREKRPSTGRTRGRGRRCWLGLWRTRTGSWSCRGRRRGSWGEDSEERQRIVDGAELLGQLLLQDIERKSGDGDGGVSLKSGVSKDRMVSVHDPEMRHGHKSSSKRFDGHKAAIVVDTDTQLITAVAVLAGKRSGQPGGVGVGGGERGPTPVCRCRRPWATLPMGTEPPGRLSPMRAASWWPGCRAVPTGRAFPRMTLSSTWRRAVALVRRGRSPTKSCRRESGLMPRDGSTTCGPSSSTGPNA